MLYSILEKARWVEGTMVPLLISFPFSSAEVFKMAAFNE